MTTNLDVLGGLADGVAVKIPCACATTADMTGALIGLPVIDGYQTRANDRVLVWQNADQTTNGIYNAQSGAWARAIDFSNTSAAVAGTEVYVFGGALYAGTTFIVQEGDIVFGASPIVFEPWEIPETAVPAGVLLPPGLVLAFAGPTPPPGFLLCYGQTVLQSACPALFATIGTTWGPANGGFFTLPDFRGRTLAGADNMGGSAANNLTGYVLGSVGGEQTHQLITAEIPAHAHSLTDGGHVHSVTDGAHQHSAAGGIFLLGNISVGSDGFSLGTAYGERGGASTTSPALTGIAVNSATTGITINPAGGGGAHNNIQPTAGINWIIKT